MAWLLVEGDEVVVRLSAPERLVARRSEVRVPLSAVAAVAVERDWWRALRGEHGSGVWIPGALSLGVRRHPRGCDFASVRTGRPVVVVDLRPPAPFSRLAVSDPDADATALVLRAATGI